jgi:hypothetical protein
MIAPHQQWMEQRLLMSDQMESPYLDIAKITLLISILMMKLQEVPMLPI